MQHTRRATVAALLLALIVAAPASSRADSAVQPEQSIAAATDMSGQRNDGLTYRVIGGGASPTEAVEIWLRCPANGYDGHHPGIARLAALSIVEAKSHGFSLRDLARDNGGAIAVQVFPAATEIGIVVPAYLAGAAQEALLNNVFHSQLDDAAFKNGKLRLAEELAIAATQPDDQLRELLFGVMFSGGPYSASTYGSATDIASATIGETQSFVSQAYLPDNAIAASAGLGGSDALGEIVTSGSPPRATGSASPPSGPSLPLSTLRTAFAPTTLPSGVTHGVSAVALGWPGPPIADERAATAMDFLSDYLMSDTTGTVTKALAAAQPTAQFDGQFITLENPGIMFAGVWGVDLDRQAAVDAIRAAAKRVVDAQLSDAVFAQAELAYRAHLLHDMSTPQSLADNLGWYFAQGAAAYTPAALMFGNGDYMSSADSLTPAYVHDIARRYLTADPAMVTLPETSGSVALRMTEGADASRPAKRISKENGS
jgi:predicted Zn-dependent peptidase